MLVTKWKEARRIRKTGEKAMNWNGGFSINEELEDILGREGRKSISTNKECSVAAVPPFCFLLFITSLFR